MFKKLLQPLWNHEKYLIILGVRGTFFAVSASLTSVFYKFAVDGLSVGNFEIFLWSAGGIAVFFLFKSVPGYFFRTTQLKFITELQRDLYLTYLAQYVSLDTNETERIGTGNMNSILQKGSDNRMEIIKQIPQTRSEKVLTISIGLVTVFRALDRVAGLITTIAVGIMIGIGMYGNYKVAKYRVDKRDAYIATDRNIVKMIMSKMEIMQTGNINQELNKISGFFNVILKARINESKGFIRGFDIPRGTMDIIRISLFVYLGYGIMQGRYGLGDLVLVRTLMKLIELSIREMNDLITDFMRRIIFVEKLRDTFENIPTINGYDTGSKFMYTGGTIELKDITYAYTSESNVFKNFTLTIQGGKKTALVGMSGSGKSTLVKLIAGYLRPDEGSVLVDGQDLKEVSLKSYYPHIGYLTQDPSVFDGTIRENLLYAVGEAGEKELKQAIELSKCEFVYDLPQGLDTEIGERGVRLSGGQRQRLAIAKIFLKDPEIIILDEPTSALDSFSEEAITEAMHKLFENRTVIIIAHRLQTVKEADEIILLGADMPTGRDEISFVQDHQGSQIQERGTHEELVQLGGQYARMLEVQTGF